MSTWLIRDRFRACHLGEFGSIQFCSQPHSQTGLMTAPLPPLNFLLADLASSD
jgi:hypothetical protein